MNKNIISKIEERGIILNRNLIKYFWGLAFFTLILVLSNYLINFDELDFQKIQNDFELNALPTILFDFISVYISWFFIIWAFTFIPTLVYYSTKASTKVELDIVTQRHKYWNLFFIILFPSVFFSFLWLSLPQRDSNLEFPAHDIKAFGFSFLVGLIVYFILKGVIRIVEIKKISFYIPFFLVLIYTSLILNYGFGFNEISYGTLFGILGFLATDFSIIREFGRRLTLYDLPEKFIASIDGVYDKINETNEMRLENEAERYSIEKDKEIAETKRMKFQSNRLKAEQERINKIEELKYSYTQDADSTKFKIINDKIIYLKKIHTLLSDIYTEKIDIEIPKKLEEIKNKANQISQTELINMLDSIYNEMDNLSKPIPAKLAELEKQMENLIEPPKDDEDNN